MKYVAVTIVFFTLIGFWKARQLWKSASAEASEDEESDEEIERRFEVERTTIEVAPWFGTTGLSEADERELPRYLRREFGEFLIDGDALRAADLTYLGVQADSEGLAHWWAIPDTASGETYAYACIDIDKDGDATGVEWGNREPPRTTP